MTLAVMERATSMWEVPRPAPHSHMNRVLRVNPPDGGVFVQTEVVLVNLSGVAV